jgi:hypothetical protein
MAKAICAIAHQIQLRERAWLTWCVWVLHDQTNITLDLFALWRYHSVFARILDPKTNWYAFNGSNRIETNNSCVQQIGGKRSITQDRRCLRQRWKSRTIQIGSILVQDEEVCCYSLDVLNFSNGPNGQSNLIQN